ncbi:hypothetical protein ACFCX4_32845 [Kitasatospora sp. NPDC056327]|uniref:hypothetical protein n=1 Tax=Kitasatospora sp. NPDC056327 TaxID=3345785 RepID=UPI0035DE3FE0
MYPLGLGAVSWWWLAVLVTATFWAFLVPGMPTRTHRTSTALAPLLMALFGVGSYHAKHMEAATVLAMYSFAVLSILAGTVGHRRELARRLTEANEKGEPEGEAAPPAMLAQLLVSFVLFGALTLWAVR